jgi:hypothetical protein
MYKNVLMRGSSNSQHISSSSSLNNIFIIIASCCVAFSLFSKSMTGLIVYIPIFFYLIVAILAGLNFNKCRNLRKGLLLLSPIVVYTVFLAIFQTQYLSQFSLRIISILLTIVVFLNIRISRKAINYIGFIFLSIFLYYAFSSIGYNAQFTGNNLIGNFEFQNNPNTMALVVLFSYIFLDRTSLMTKKYFFYGFTLLAVYSINNYDSRNALVCLILYLILKKILQYTSINTKKILIVVISILSIVMPIFYVSYYNSSQKIQNSEVLGKDVYSGRQNIWIDASKYQNTKTVLFGSSNQELLKTLPSNSLHSTCIDLIYRLGLIFYILYMFILYRLIFMTERLPNIVFGSIVVLLIYGLFESSFQSGGYASLLMLFVFIVPNSPQISNSLTKTVKDK